VSQLDVAVDANERRDDDVSRVEVVENAIVREDPPVQEICSGQPWSSINEHSTLASNDKGVVGAGLD
jgi:hypothetical protein